MELDAETEHDDRGEHCLGPAVGGAVVSEHRQGHDDGGQDGRTGEHSELRACLLVEACGRGEPLVARGQSVDVIANLGYRGLET